MDATKREIRNLECELAFREATPEELAQGQLGTITGRAICFNAESEILDDDGDVFILKVTEENGETYYKSDVIVPGQYIEKLAPVKKFSNEAFDAQIMIYSFEEGTWYSGGTVEIAATVQAW